ncbi:hypothetical protein C1703_16410 [Streptomyces sp. Go-475]|nr:hypothetical protein C1703_16410 [Streptomyces sp. Go-475]
MPCRTVRRRRCPLSLMSAINVTSHRLGSLAPLACLRLAFGFLALFDGVRRPLATVQVASRRTDHRQPPAPSALLRERSTPGLRTSHVSHPRSRPSCGRVQDCRAHVLCGRRTAPRSGARRPKEAAQGRTLCNCPRGRSGAFMGVQSAGQTGYACGGGRGRLSAHWTKTRTTHRRKSGFRFVRDAGSEPSRARRSTPGWRWLLVGLSHRRRLGGTCEFCRPAVVAPPDFEAAPPTRRTARDRGASGSN